MPIEVADNIILVGSNKLSAALSQHKLDGKAVLEGQTMIDMCIQ